MFSDHGLSPAGTSFPLLPLPSPPRTSVAPSVHIVPTLPYILYLQCIIVYCSVQALVSMQHGADEDFMDLLNIRYTFNSSNVPV